MLKLYWWRASRLVDGCRGRPLLRMTTSTWLVCCNWLNDCCQWQTYMKLAFFNVCWRIRAMLWSFELYFLHTAPVSPSSWAHTLSVRWQPLTQGPQTARQLSACSWSAAEYVSMLAKFNMWLEVRPAGSRGQEILTLSAYRRNLVVILTPYNNWWIHGELWNRRNPSQMISPSVQKEGEH